MVTPWMRQQIGLCLPRYAAHCWLHSSAFHHSEMCLRREREREKIERLDLYLFIIPLLIFSNPSGPLFSGVDIHIRSTLYISFPLPKASHWQHFTGNQQSGWISCLIIWCEAARGRTGELGRLYRKKGCVHLERWDVVSLYTLISSERWLLWGMLYRLNGKYASVNLLLLWKFLQHAKLCKKILIKKAS